MLREHITSLRNPKVKELQELQDKSKVRKEQGLFVVEGIREIRHCLEGGFSPRSFFLCSEILSAPSLEALFQGLTFDFDHIDCFEVSIDVYHTIAYRDSTEGIVAEFYTKPPFLLSDIDTSDSPLILVLESVEKPGNLGAVLRTADAARVDAVIVCDSLTDIFNPNIIRTSLGGVFTSKIVCCPSSEAISWLKEHHIHILTAQLQDSHPYYDIDMTLPTAIVLGAESTGLSNSWREASDAKINIPMFGKLDSLNVSISAAILCYEAVRQRHQI